MFVFTLYITLFQKERREEEEREQGLEKIKATFRKLRHYMKNRLFIKYALYLLSYFPCFAFVEYVGLAKLIRENKISNTQYTLLNLCLTPF